jgi:serine/threonine protein kinase
MPRWPSEAYSYRADQIDCRCPFIVRLHSTFQTSNKLFFVLEYCPGGELYRLLKFKKKFDEKVTKFYAAQVLEALDYLHKRGIVHRDLKLENLAIDRAGYLRLIDFGMAIRIG